MQHNADPLGFSIPVVVLALAGISVGSAVTVTAAKVVKNSTRPANVAAAAPGPWRPSLIQIFLLEEGTYADQVVDITKFQHFIITVVLVLAYIGLAVHTVTAAGTAAKVTALPGFSGTFLVLLAISHAAYLAGKLPSPGGQPTGLTVASRDVVAWAAAKSATSAGRQSAGLRRGELWRPRANVNVWSEGTPITEIPAGGTLVVTDSRSFVLRWATGNWHPPVHDDAAIPVGSDRYAVTLTHAELAGATEVQFTRRYLDRIVDTGPASGWEGSNHVVWLQPLAQP